MSSKRDHIMAALLTHDNIIAMQLVIMTPAFSASAKDHLACAGLMTGLYFFYTVIFYFISPKIPQKLFILLRYAPLALLTGLCALIFMAPLHAFFCALYTLAAELILMLINSHISDSGVSIKLQLPASLISAALLCAAFSGLRL